MTASNIGGPPASDVTTAPRGAALQAWIVEHAAVLVVVLVGVLVPAVRMGRVALSSSRTQYNDYWPMLDTLLAEGGGIRWRGLLEARNGHPVVVPKLLYLANVGLTNGSNHGQAAIVFALVAGIVVLVGLLCRGTPGLGRWGRTALVVVSATVLFAPYGTWSFVKAMSGTAWLSANLFVVAALLAQQRGRRWLTPVLGVLATISYGTGLVVWPALVVAGALRDRRSWRRQWPTWVVGAVVGALYLDWNRGRAVPGGRAGLVETVRRAFELLFGLFGGGASTLVLGAVAGVVVVVAIVACRDRLAAAAPWIGLLAFASGTALLISSSRDVVGQTTGGGPGFGAGVPSRYWTIAAWAWIGISGLVVVALRDRRWRAGAVVPLLVVVVLGGSSVDVSLRSNTEAHDLVAVGLHTGLTEGNVIGGGRQRFPALTDRLQDIGHYPFDGTFDLDCGLLGKVVTLEDEPPEGLRGEVRRQPLEGVRGVIHLAGRLDTGGRPIDCVVVVDAESRVVGAGPARSWGDPRFVRVRAIAPAAFGLRLAVRFSPEGRLWTVPTAPDP